MEFISVALRKRPVDVVRTRIGSAVPEEDRAKLAESKYRPKS